MSDTPRNDSTEGRGDDVFRDPTAPSDAPSYGPPDTSGSVERTEQLPTGGDTQQVPTESSVPPPPPAPPGGGAAPQSPYAAPPTGAVPQNPYASPPVGSTGQNPYASPPAGEPFPSQGQVAAQHGTPGTPLPPGTPPPPGYGQPPAYGQGSYGAPGHTPGASLSGSSLALLIVSGLLTFVGCGVGIPALVFGIIALTKKDEPAENAKWTRWGWIALGVTIALAVVGFVLVIALAVGSSSVSSGSGY